MPNGTDGSLKVPSQVFRWFEKMKSNYEQSVQSVLSRFENYNANQQERIDNIHQTHLSDIKMAHQNQIEQNQNQIKQLLQDVNYYKQQIAQQQQTIEQLNSRYDTVIACLIKEKNTTPDVKDIFSNDDFLTADNTELSSPEPISFHKTEQTLTEQENDNKPSSQAINVTEELTQDKSETITSQLSNDVMFEQAIEHRNNQDYELGFNLFHCCANNNHVKSMGAMGRSYFLGEGVEEDHKLGLAWLIKAAELELPQAISRVEHFKNSDPNLYQHAIELVDSL